jgi:hypothetical protein
MLQRAEHRWQTSGRISGGEELASKRTEQIEHFNQSMQNRDQRAAANKAAEKAALEAALEAARGDPITNAINRVNGIAEQDMFPLYV